MLLARRTLLGAAGAAQRTFLKDIQNAGLSSGLKLCLDAGAIASYPGSGQKWLDLSGGGYDFFRGADVTATTDDPTFNGVAGKLSAAEYFGFDGGDKLRYDTTNETWMQALHKDSAIFTMLAWVYATGQGGLAGTGGATSGGTGFIWFTENTGNRVRFLVYNTTNPVLDKYPDAALGYNAWHLIGVSVNEPAGAGNGFLYKDGNYDQVSVSNFFDPTYASPAAGNAAQTMEIGALGNAGSPMANGGRLGGMMIWQGTALSKVQIDLLWTAQRGRFGV